MVVVASSIAVGQIWNDLLWFVWSAFFWCYVLVSAGLPREHDV